LTGLNQNLCTVRFGDPYIPKPVDVELRISTFQLVQHYFKLFVEMLIVLRFVGLSRLDLNGISFSQLIKPVLLDALVP
jgi:hypothetical protein